MLKLGDKFPSYIFKWIPQSDANACVVKGVGSPEDLLTDSWKNSKVVLIFLPGAFTPVCSSRHLPDFLENYDIFKSKGVDFIGIVSSNDAYVMAGWGDVYHARDKILFLSDPDGLFSRLYGWELDLIPHGLGIRANRYALVITNGVVTYVGLEENPATVTVSGAEAVLAAL